MPQRFEHGFIVMHMPHKAIALSLDAATTTARLLRSYFV
jgi:hypothetical protein